MNVSSLARITLRQARRLVLSVVGTTVVLLGLVMVVTPGPALLVVPAGLAILGLEFAWARRLLRRAKLEIRLARRSRRTARTGESFRRKGRRGAGGPG